VLTGHPADQQVSGFVGCTCGNDDTVEVLPKLLGGDEVDPVFCFVEFALLGVEFELHEYFIYLFYTSVKLLLIGAIEAFRDRRNEASG